MSVITLLVIDMINPSDHEDADLLAADVEKMVAPPREVLDQARGREDVRVLYINDNYGERLASPPERIPGAGH